MDILEANVPHLIPKTAEQYNDQEYKEFSGEVEAMYSHYNRGVVGDSENEGEPCSDEYLQAIVQDLEVMASILRMRGGETGEEWIHMRCTLDHIQSECDRLLTHDVLFKNATTRKSFLNKVKAGLKEVRNAWKMWDEYETAAEKAEQEVAADSQYTPERLLKIENFTPWGIASENIVNRKKPATEVNPVDKGKELDTQEAFKYQYLRRAGVTILEHWIKDTEEAIEEIVKASGNEDVRKLGGKRQDVYNGQAKDLRPGYESFVTSPELYTAVPPFRYDDQITINPRVTAAARFLERLEGMRNHTREQAAFKVMLKTYLDAEGMRAIPEMKEMEEKDVGRL